MPTITPERYAETAGAIEREIGKVLDLTESRVSQILRQAVLRLRSSLIDWGEEA